MTIRLRKVLGAAVATALGVAGLAAPSTANAPQRETGFLSGCLTDATGHVALSFIPTLTGVAALVGIGDATVTGASGDEVESLVAGSFFEDTTFVKTEAGVAQTIDVEATTVDVSATSSSRSTRCRRTTSTADAEVLTRVHGQRRRFDARRDARRSRRTAGVRRCEPRRLVPAGRLPTTGPMRFEANPNIGCGFLDDAGDLDRAGAGDLRAGQRVHAVDHRRQHDCGRRGRVRRAVRSRRDRGTNYKISVSSGDGTGEFASAFGYSAPGVFTLTWEPVVVAPLPTIKPGSRRGHRK